MYKTKDTLPNARTPLDNITNNNYNDRNPYADKKEIKTNPSSHQGQAIPKLNKLYDSVKMEKQQNSNYFF